MPRDLAARIDTWIFDLDQTLYHPRARLFDQINARITGFIMRELGLGRAQADALRAQCWRDHGTTLAGLQQHHPIDPTAFLAEIHDIDLGVLRPDPALRAAIQALPGTRLIHTNGARAHAHRVLAARGLTDLWHGIYAIEDKDLTPKPRPEAYQAILTLHPFDPTRALMFEDDPQNLIVPKNLGMTTVWLCHTPGAPTPPHVDHRITDLTRFLTGPLASAASAR